eukprot:TRINITY_DN59500_c0_g1_i1.p1 TRINITY_DN59500_c0_g1~~TRINITY_DN59500_c0_g1_i1.p1  ORF type:complete len:824 (-),score=174.82 TRINITY_DN59500_c0_g1_i1:34-2505(-)
MASGTACASPAPTAAFAKEAFGKGDYETAQVAFADVAGAWKAVGDNIQGATALSNRAQCFIKLERFADAASAAQEAALLDETSVKAWFRLGTCNSRLRRWTQAQDALTKALFLEPQNIEAANALRDCRRRELEASGCYAFDEAYGRFLETQGLQPVQLEPFVGPVRVASSSERGRGLFVTEKVRRGQLLLCAEALVATENGGMLEALSKVVERNASLREVVLSLSRGTAESEQRLPNRTMDELAAPGCWAHVPEGAPAWGLKPPPPDHMEELTEILKFNQHALSYVNPNAAPIEMSSDPRRSGLWLLPAFLNHSCAPNVQRLIVHDRLLLRAARDLEAGEELFDCYIKALQPLRDRRRDLQGYGFACCCNRCRLEEAVLDAGAVEAVLQRGVEAAAAGKDVGGQKAETQLLEEAVQEADALVGQALEAHLRVAASDAVQKSLLDQILPHGLPQHAPLPAAKVVQVRWGFESLFDAQEEAMFRAQERLHNLLMGALAGLIRQQALALKGDATRHADQIAAWDRLMDVLDEVLPCSELRAATSSERLYVKLLTQHLNARKCPMQVRAAVIAHHEAFGGGGGVWRALNKHMFSKEVVDFILQEAPGICKGLGLPDDSYDPADFKPKQPSSATRQSIGFEERLRRKIRDEKRAATDAEVSGTSLQAGRADPPHRVGSAAEKKSPAESSTAAGGYQAGAGNGASAAKSSGQSVPAAQAEAREATPQKPCTEMPTTEKTSAGSPPSSFGSYQLEESCDGMVVTASIPGVETAAQADMEVSARELRLWNAAQGAAAGVLTVKLPRTVDPDSAAAKWSKKSKQLTVKLAAA